MISYRVVQLLVFQTVDTDFSPGDQLQLGDCGQFKPSGFRPLTRISLLVTTPGAPTATPDAQKFQTVDTDFSPGD